MTTTKKTMSSLDEQLTSITVTIIVSLLLFTNSSIAEPVNCDNVSYTFAEKGIDGHVPTTSSSSSSSKELKGK